MIHDSHYGRLPDILETKVSINIDTTHETFHSDKYVKTCMYLPLWNPCMYLTCKIYVFALVKYPVGSDYICRHFQRQNYIGPSTVKPPPTVSSTINRGWAPCLWVPPAMEAWAFVNFLLEKPPKEQLIRFIKNKKIKKKDNFEIIFLNRG